MSDTENTPQQPEDDEQPSPATPGDKQDDSSDLRPPVDSDPPIIIGGTGNP